jgi:1-acyl-sn-glycerol-3-phosphate acyltransferase
VLYAVTHALFSTVLRVVWRPRILGVENLPRRGPVILASNHLSFIDSLVIPLAAPARLRVTFLAKADYFTGGGLRGAPRRLFFRATGAIPVERDEANQARESLETALEVLQRGWAFGLYPEGTRSRDGRLYRGRPGVGWLALSSGAPVVPVGLVGTDRVQPVGARWPRLAPVTIRFGEAIPPEAYADVRPAAQARRRLTDDVMDAVAVLTGQERAPGYNERHPEH